MGSDDPRLDQHGNTDYRLAQQLRGYTKLDPPPRRVKPVPIQLVLKIADWAYSARPRLDDFCAIADMIIIGFFFLMRPGEHTMTHENTPFRIEDVKMYDGPHLISLNTATPAELRRATAVSLTFTNQKNGVKGEVISHCRSGHPLCCPVRAIARRILYHRQIRSPPSTPICQYAVGNQRKYVRSKDITTSLRTAISLLLHQGETLDIAPEDISARSLRAGGATALLFANIDKLDIQLIGRWKSDAMIRYLHVMAAPTLHMYAQKMFHGGHFDFRPGFFAPSD